MLASALTLYGEIFFGDVAADVILLGSLAVDVAVHECAALLQMFSDGPWVAF